MKRLAVIIACGLLIAACGSSSKPQSRGASSDPLGVAFAQCMRTHGQPNFSDPRTGPSGGFESQVPSQSPAGKAALKDCQHLAPGGPPSLRAVTGQEMAAALRVSDCMRRHGVSGFPDPTTNPPAPSSMGRYSLAMIVDGAVMAIPNSINVQSPTFTRASKVCGFGPHGPK